MFALVPKWRKDTQVIWVCDTKEQIYFMGTEQWLTSAYSHEENAIGETRK